MSPTARPSPGGPGGAALHAVPPGLGAENGEVSSFCRFWALERTARALGEPQTAAFFSWASAANSISAKGVFRGVVVLPWEL
eukprot:9710307-Alexandrium_andersonii.AAC.1